MAISNIYRIDLKLMTQVRALSSGNPKWVREMERNVVGFTLIVADLWVCSSILTSRWSKQLEIDEGSDRLWSFSFSDTLVFFFSARPFYAWHLKMGRKHTHNWIVGRGPILNHPINYHKREWYFYISFHHLINKYTMQHRFLVCSIGFFFNINVTLKKRVWLKLFGKKTSM